MAGYPFVGNCLWPVFNNSCGVSSRRGSRWVTRRYWWYYYEYEYLVPGLSGHMCEETSAGARDQTCIFY